MMPTLSPKVIYWGKTLSKFVSVQLVVQVLVFASGILLIRTLDQQQYAYYTIANTMQGTMNLLADSGISIGLSVIGGKVWQDRYRFGQLINTALQLRLTLAAIAIAIITPILVWMLISNGASVVYAIFIAAALLMGLNAQLTIGVLDVVPRLHSQLNRVQNLDLLSAISRLVLLCGAYFLCLNTAVAVLIGSISLLFKRWILSRWVTDSIDTGATINKEDRTALIKIIKKLTPNNVFYSIQGQLTILLISIFGNTKSIAEVGALGRLAVIFTLISSIMDSIVLPSFARCQSPKLLHRRYWQIIGVHLLVSSSILSLAILFPEQLLWVLGSKYMHLRNEVVLIIISSVIHSFAATLWSINSTKAWIRHAWLLIPTFMVTQILLLLFLDFSTVKGVILFGLLSIVPALFLNFYMTYEGLVTSLVNEN